MSKKVLYRWSEDGETELCSRNDFTAQAPGLCYHCDYSIPVGSEVSLLRSVDGGYYRMHSNCADQGIVPRKAKSDFQNYLNEQLKDPEFHQWWATRQHIIEEVAGSMALSDMPLTEEDMERIQLVADDPDEVDRIVQELVKKHKL